MKISIQFLIEAKMTVILLFLSSVLLHFAYATTFYPAPFPSSVYDAPVIVRGTIGTRNSDWNQDADGIKRLFTYYSLQVKEAFKGNISGSSIKIRELGGEKDGVGLEVPGASQYQQNEDVIVFLKNQSSDGSYEVEGMMMGKYNIQKDQNNTEYLIGASIDRNSKWTLNALRNLIREQSSSGQSNTATTQSQIHASPSASPQDSSAQQLHSITPNPLESISQSSSNQNSSQFPFQRYIFYLGISLLGALGIARLLKPTRHK